MLFLEEKSSSALSCNLLNHSKCAVEEKTAIRLQQEGGRKPLRLCPETGIPVWYIIWDSFTHQGEGGFSCFLCVHAGLRKSCSIDHCLLRYPQGTQLYKCWHPSDAV